MIRCMNCSSSGHEIEDCPIDTTERDEASVVAEAIRAAHTEEPQWPTPGT